MSVSPEDKVRALYDSTASTYDTMMDQEIHLPIYDRVLSDMANATRSVPGTILDSSCGSGHMLLRIAKDYCPGRALLGVDLSQEMVSISRRRLGGLAKVSACDMSSLPQIQDAACAVVISFFAIHHVDSAGLEKCLDEWCRVLETGGHLFLAAWEGNGNIDYGDESEVIARRFNEAEIVNAASSSGFHVARHFVEPVDEMEMDAVHLVAVKR